MRTIRNAVLVAMTLGGVSMAACSSESPSLMPGSSVAPPKDSNQWGMISTQLQLGPGVTLASVTYTITNPGLAGFTTVTGSVDVSNS